MSLMLEARSRSAASAADHHTMYEDAVRSSSAAAAGQPYHHHQPQQHHGDPSASQQHMRSGSAPAGPAADETHCLRSVVDAVNTGLRRLTHGTLRSMALADGAAAFSPAATHDMGAVVSAADCAEFLHLAESVISSVADDATKLQAILFDAPFDLLATLSNVISARLRADAGISIRIPSADQQERLDDMRVAALTATKACALACGEDAESEGLLGRLLVTAFRTNAVLPGTFSLLSHATTPERVRLAAAELLFVCTLKLDCIGYMRPQDLQALLDAMAFDPSVDVRAFLCAAARDIVVRQCEAAVDRRIQGTAPTHGSGGGHDEDHDQPKSGRFDATAATTTPPLGTGPLFDACVAAPALRALLKLLVLDDTADVRVLCAGAIRSRIAAAVHAAAPRLDESDLLDVAEAVASRLADMTASSALLGGARNPLPDDDEAEALCGVLDDVAVLAARCGFESFFVLVHHRHVASAQLVRLLFRSIPVAAASAKALRAIIERCPPHLPVAGELAASAPIAALCRTTLSIDLAANGTTVAHQVLCVEAALILGLVFLTSPRARRAAMLELAATPSVLAALPGKLRAHMSAADIDYFYDLLLLDESAVLLNDDTAPSLSWDDDTNLAVESIQLVVESQELRSQPDEQSASWRSSSLAAWTLVCGLRDGHRGGSSIEKNHQNSFARPNVGPQPTPEGARRRACMAFSLISFAIHLVVTNAAAAARGGDSAHASPIGSLQRHGSHGRSTGHLGESGHQLVTLNKAAGHSLRMPSPSQLHHHHQSPPHQHQPHQQSPHLLSAAAASQRRDRITAGIDHMSSIQRARDNAAAHASASRSPRRDDLVSDYSPGREGHPNYAPTPRERQQRLAAEHAGHYSPTRGADHYRNSRKQQYPHGPPGNVGGPAAAQLDAHPGVEEAANRVTVRLRKARAAAEAARRQADEASKPLKTQFGVCLQLVQQLAQHFSADVDTSRGPQYAPDATAGGLVARRASSPAASARRRTTSPRVGAPPKNLKNPWEVVRRPHSDPKRWTLAAVEEGDLFFFAIPLAALTVTVTEAVISKARHHLRAVKKALAVAPHNQKNRRHFLEDMFGAVMPGIITRLQRIGKFLVSCTEAHVQMTLSVLPSVVSAAARSNGEKVVDGGNLCNVLDYLTHYFSKASGTGERAQVAAAAAASGGGYGGGAANRGGTASAGPPSPRLDSVSGRGSPTGDGGASPGIAPAVAERFLAPHGISTAQEQRELSRRGPLFAETERRSSMDTARARRVLSNELTHSDDDDDEVSEY